MMKNLDVLSASTNTLNFSNLKMYFQAQNKIFFWLAAQRWPYRGTPRQLNHFVVITLYQKQHKHYFLYKFVKIPDHILDQQKPWLLLVLRLVLKRGQYDLGLFSSYSSHKSDDHMTGPILIIRVAIFHSNVMCILS